MTIKFCFFNKYIKNLDMGDFGKLLNQIFMRAKNRRFGVGDAL